MLLALFRHIVIKSLSTKFFQVAKPVSLSLLNYKSLTSVDAFVGNAEYMSVWCPCTDGVSSKRACVFCLSLPHGPNKRSVVTFQADDLYSKKSWLECLELVCKNARLRVESID